MVNNGSPNWHVGVKETAFVSVLARVRGKVRECRTMTHRGVAGNLVSVSVALDAEGQGSGGVDVDVTGTVDVVDEKVEVGRTPWMLSLNLDVGDGVDLETVLSWRLLLRLGWDWSLTVDVLVNVNVNVNMNVNVNVELNVDV